MPRAGSFAGAILALACVAAGPPHVVFPPLAPLVSGRSPFLVSADCTATYSDGAFSGTLTWAVANPNSRPVVWTFAPPRVALGALRWQSGDPVRLTRIAPVGPFADGQLAIDVPANGGTISGEWSARSADERGAKRFDLRFPPAGVATLDLTLPTPLRPVVRLDEALLTGPFPTGDTGTARWRLSFGGRERLTVFVPTPAARTAANPGPVTRAAKWVVGAGRADGTVTFTPERPFVAWDELVFELNAAVRVAGVTTDGPCAWHVDPPAPGQSSQTLRVRPLDPDGASRLQISLLTNPPTPGVPWGLPSLRLRGRAPHEDSLTVRTDDTLRTVAWEPGDYRVTHVESGESGGRIDSAEGTFGKGSDGDRRPPVITFDDPRPEVTVAERSTYTIDRTERRVHVVAGVTVRRGPVRSLRFTVPAPFRLAAPPSVTDDDGPDRPDPQGPAYDVAFARPLGHGQTATIVFSLLAPTPAAQSGLVRVTVPAVIWDGSERTGTASVRPSAAFEPGPPLLVAYQDVPPPGDVILNVKNATARPPSRFVHAAMTPPSDQTVPPERISVRVGMTGLDVTLTGRGSNPVRIALPDGFELTSVRLADRVLDRVNRDGNALALPFSGGPNATYEIRGRIAWRVTTFGQARVNGIESEAWTWESDSGVRVWPRGPTAWVVREDALHAASLGLTVALLLPSFVAFRRGPGMTRAGIVLLLAAGGFGALTLSPPFGETFRLPASVALVAFAVSIGIRRAVLVITLLAAGPTLADPPVLVALTNATYRATETTDEFTLNAVWDVGNSTLDPRPLTIPLVGAKVVSIRLDGDAAFPEPLPAGGFRLFVGPGTHRLEANVVVPMSVTGGEKSIRFDGPEVPRGTLTFTAAEETTGVSVSSRRGRQVTNGAVTTADLGEGRIVTLRWRPAGAAPDSQPLEPTKERTTYVVSEGTATATADITFPTSRPGPRYRIAIPAGWSPDHVTTRSAETNGAIPSDWSMDAMRNLIVTTRLAAVGGVVATVVLSPDRPLSENISLPLVRATEGPDPLAVYAVRLDRVVANKWVRTGTIDWPADTTARGPVNLAARKADGPVRLTLTVSPLIASPVITQAWTWVLGRKADVTAEMSVTGSVAPSVRIGVNSRIRVLSVRGTDLLDWRRDGDHVEMDLASDRDGAPIRWAGTTGPLGAGEHALPIPPSPRPAIVRIRQASGWTARVVPGPGVSAVPNEPDAWSVGPQAESLRVAVSEANLSPTPPTPVIVPPPVTTQTSRTEKAHAVSPPPPPSPSRDYWPLAGWLAGFGAVAMVARFGQGRFRPECVTGLGLLGWATLGPGFVALVVVGLLVRLVRTIGAA